MALVNCPECSHQISDQAAACPHCGCPSTTPSLGGRAQPLHGKFVGLAARRANTNVLVARRVAYGVLGVLLFFALIALVQTVYEANFADSPLCAEAKYKAKLAWSGTKYTAVYGPRREFTKTEMLEHAAEACGKDPAKTDLPKWLDLH